MADATVIINRITGAVPVKSRIDNVAKTRANAFDSHTTGDTSNPIQIPAAGTNYSYWVNTQLEITANPSTHTLNNIKWYTDGANNFTSGVGCNVLTASVYSQATGTPGTTGTELTKANYDLGAGTANNDLTDAFTETSGAPKTVAGTSSATGDLGDLVVYQLTVASTAVSGVTGDETFTFQYDEA